MADNSIIYDGHKRDLPQFLPWFTIPLPREWFGALFSSYKKQGATIYKDDAYGVATGYIVYDCQEAYLDGAWLSALKTMRFAVQVEWAEPTKGMPKKKRPSGAMQVTVFTPNKKRTCLERCRTLGTTQKRWLAFLKTGNLADLEPHSKFDSVFELDPAA